jgi:hypothetical protein
LRQDCETPDDIGVNTPDWNAAPSSRPLHQWPLPRIEAQFAAALDAGHGPSGAHCIHELWMRAEVLVNVGAALERLWKSAAASIPEWLPMTAYEFLPLLYEVTARFTPRARGRSNIYLVLLDYSDRRDGPHGVYVGMTQHAPAVRFDQHKAGIRAAGSVLKRGLEVLTGPALHLQHLRRDDAADVEMRLAEALGAEGLIVQGGH